MGKLDIELKPIGSLRPELTRKVMNFIGDASNYDEDGSNGIDPAKLVAFIEDLVMEEYELFVDSIDNHINRAHDMRFGGSNGLQRRN